MTTPVLYDQSDDGIVTLTLNMPEKRNPISERAMVDAIVDALHRMERDRSVRVAILTGAGPAFSSGGDLRAMQDSLDARAADPTATLRYYTEGIQRIPLAFEALDVPIIAAVNGPAIGAGNDLACMCDLRICSDTARFAESFVKLGIIAGDGGAWLLPRIVGWSKACEMALTGDPVSANEALECGLVSKVVPAAELMDAARTLARRIAANPTDAVRATKRLLKEGRFARMDTALQLAAQAQALAHARPEHREALGRMLTPRK